MPTAYMRLEDCMESSHANGDSSGFSFAPAGARPGSDLDSDRRAGDWRRNFAVRRGESGVAKSPSLSGFATADEDRGGRRCGPGDPCLDGRFRGLAFAESIIPAHGSLY